MAEPSMAARVHGSPALTRRRRLGRALCHALGRVQVEGLDRIPTTGPVLLAANHRSFLDGPLLVGFVDRPVSCLVKIEAFGPGLGTLLRSAGQIPVAREVVDPAPVRLCLRILRAGGVVGIFPEGTRGDGRVRTAKPGVGYLALRSGATVVPVACHGTAEMVRSLRRGPGRMVIGEPIRFEQHPEHRPLHRARSAAATERVRAALATLVAAGPLGSIQPVPAASAIPTSQPGLVVRRTSPERPT